MAQAIAEALLEVEPTLTVDIVDVFSAECSIFPLTAVPNLYVLSTAILPVLWRSLYRITDNPIRYRLVECLALPFMRPRLRKMLERTRPDAVISVLPTLSHAIHSTLTDLGRMTTLGVVVADLVTIHAGWRYRGTTWYATHTEEARQSFIAAGIDPQSVFAFGLPIGRSFRPPPAGRSSLRQELGLPLDQPVVLIAGGASGAGSIEATATACITSNISAHWVIFAGRNERLYRRLTRRTQNSSCRILRFVDNMADWMHAADVLVTKAGPSTIVEAIQCGLPLVLTGALPQEVGNVAYVKSNNLGLVATTPQEVVACVGRILTDCTLSASIKSAMQRIQRPEAAHLIARLILAHC